MLRGFGINEPEWKALHGVEWTKIGDRTYLFPNDALKLSDDQVKAYIAEARPMGQGMTAGIYHRKNATRPFTTSRNAITKIRKMGGPSGIARTRAGWVIV